MKVAKDQQGFTLVEMLVALFIFGMISAAGAGLLSFSLKAQDAAEYRLEQLAEVRRAALLLTSDFSQAAPRITRGAKGEARAAFRGGSGGNGDLAVAFVRRGWENVDGAPRPSLQKVEYGYAGGALQRRVYRHLDGAEPMASVRLLNEVEGLSLRYRGDKGQWLDSWSPERPSELPSAVEMVVQLKDRGSLRQLFLVGAGA